jgi:glycosyltransferase involved in cell wall biosynthesis
MKILVAHNRYQARGGEDVVEEAEVALLEQAGHQVETLNVSNNAIDSVSARIATVLAVADNPEGTRMMAEAIDRVRPEVVHVHNFFPLLSPAIFDVCRQKRVPAVVTLHNFRTICTGGILLRNGRLCHKCPDAGHHLWGVVHRCYRGSLLGSAASAYMIATHQHRGTWTRPGLRMIALSAFARGVFVQAGFDPDMIDVKPNFMPDPGRPDPSAAREGLLYVGRLSPEKGIDVLLQAAAESEAPLRIAGDGPELAALRASAPRNITFLGAIARAEVLTEMSRARALVVPSLWYEGFPMVIVEAFANGTPVIASDLGGRSEIVQSGVNGALVPAANVDLLKQGMRAFLDDRALSDRCGQAARATYLKLYSPGENLRQLETIYERSIRDASAAYSGLRE